MFWNNKPTYDRPASAAVRATPKPRAAKSSGLSLELESPKPAKPERNSDPYNTSGSFDRTKNWERVGRR